MKYLEPEESASWLRFHLARTGIGTLSKLAEVSGINKGTLSKYFHQIQRPTIDVVAILCRALDLKPDEVLFGLGAIEGDQNSFSEISTPNSRLE